MKVDSISNNQISYKGYVDKSIRKYVEMSVQQQCNILVAEANRDLKKVNYIKLKSICEKGKNVVQKFNEFITPMHKDTSIDINSGYLHISNPIKKDSSISIFSFKYQDSSYAIKLDRDIIWLKGNNDLKKFSGLEAINVLERMAEQLKENISPQVIDKAFLDFAESSIESTARKNGTGFWGKIKTRRAVQKIKKYAEAINEKPSSSLNAEEYISKIEKEEKIASANKKMKKTLENKNRQLMNDILNNKQP